MKKQNLKLRFVAGLVVLLSQIFCLSACAHSYGRSQYPAHWWTPVPQEGAPDWEILPQAAGRNEVILSKRNELGILSNFAATPFTYKNIRYASIEGFWQMMKYPENDQDPRFKASVQWKYSREQVQNMVAFEAKKAGSLGEENMKALGIDWVTFEGRKMPYRSMIPGDHYNLILAAMKAKLEQNPEVKRILLSTGNLKLLPDHKQSLISPPEWKYYEIWMKLRSELKASN